jgi:hypothetical protein
MPSFHYKVNFSIDIVKSFVIVHKSVMDFYKHVLIVEFFSVVWLWGYCNVKIKVSIQILYFSSLKFYKNTNSLESP